MKKQKQSWGEILAKRKYGRPSTLTWLGYTLLARSPFFNGKYHVSYKIIDDINDCKGPCFVVFNHLSRRDYLFLKNISHPTRFNMVAGYNEFCRSHLSWLFDKACVIPKKNFCMDLVSVKAMTSVIKRGGCVAFSPEGMSSISGHSQPIVPGTGKFVKHFGVPVYYMHIDGAFLTSHKVCIDDRPGKIFVTMSLLFSPEQLKAMSPEEIDMKFNEAFRHDDYEWNKTARIRYRTRHRAATNLSDLLYRCPKCGSEFTIESKGDLIRCTCCGNGATIDDYYDMHPLDESCVIPVSPSAWFDQERVHVIHEIREDPNYEYVEKVKIGKIPEYGMLRHHLLSLPCGEGVVRIAHDGFHFDGTRDGKPCSFTMSYAILNTLVIENECDCFQIYDMKGEMFDFYPEKHSVGKMLLLVEEMHRLHFNTWKNFPWCDYMYKGTELEKPETPSDPSKA